MFIASRRWCPKIFCKQTFKVEKLFAGCVQALMRTRHWLAGLLAAACLTAAAQAQTETAPDASLFAPVQIAGDQSTGFPAYFYGCSDNGATLQDIIVYANNNFLRGIEVTALQLSF